MLVGNVTDCGIVLAQHPVRAVALLADGRVGILLGEQLAMLAALVLLPDLLRGTWSSPPRVVMVSQGRTREAFTSEWHWLQATLA